MTDNITNSGLASIVNAIIASGTRYIGWGTGTANSKADTNLATPAPESRQAASAAAVQTVVSGDTVQYTAILTATAPRVITEAGIFTAATNGAIEEHSTFPALNLAADDSIQFVINVQYQ